MKITAVRLVKVEGQIDRALGVSEERQVGAMDLFPEHRARVVRPPSPEQLRGTRPIDAIYVMIDTDEGITGTFGPIFEDQAYQIDTRLRPHLIGQDPIAVEHLTGALAELIPFFGRLDRARLRMVTKFAYTEGLIGLPHGGRTRIRYSLNTPYVRGFEAGTDPIEERIEAANRLGRDGYPIGFVLAPLMIYRGWEHDYEALLAGLAERLDPALLPGLSFELISHRFTARAKEIIRARFPSCRLDLDETGRRIKWGRYGHRKFVYPAEDLRRLWRLVEEAIERHFPGAVVKYAT